MREGRPEGRPRSCGSASRRCYSETRYSRSPASFFKEESFKPILLFSVPLRKPRTLCFCHPVGAMSWGRVAPAGEESNAMMSSLFLLPLSGLTGTVAFTGFSAFSCLAGSLLATVTRFWIAFQMRAVAILRLANLLTGTVPGMPFHAFISRVRGQLWTRSSQSLCE